MLGIFVNPILKYTTYNRLRGKEKHFNLKESHFIFLKSLLTIIY